MSAVAERWAEVLAAQPAVTGPEWLQDLRQRAAAQFHAAGLPHRKVEAWKYTPVTRLDRLQPAAGTAGTTDGGWPEPLCVADLTADLLDGVPVSAPSKTPAGVRLQTLEDALRTDSKRLQPLLEAVDTAGPQHAFAALNTALLGAGLVLEVDAGVDAGRLLLRWAFAAASEPLLHPGRLLLLLGPGARLDLVEQFESAGATDGALNLLCQVELGQGAHMSHLRLQREAGSATLLTATNIRQDASSRYRYRGFDLGGSLARHELNVTLAGEGAEADLAGAFVLDGRRYGDHHVSVDHAAPGCRSEQFFRGVLGGSSRGVFNGRALIREGADGSSVRQSNANLLLSPLAEMDTKPELEIYADEVEASHGATVGQLDEAAVFYLRSRGLSEAQARRMLTTAFCQAVTDRLDDRDLGTRINGFLATAMPGEESPAAL